MWKTFKVGTRYFTGIKFSSLINFPLSSKSSFVAGTSGPVTFTHTQVNIAHVSQGPPNLGF